MKIERIVGIVVLVLVVVLPTGAHAQRELSWDALTVDATVKADGSLHVIEEQRMVFDGDWNGGERVFRLGPRQRIELLGIERIDPASGERRTVQPGSLDTVDRWAWTDGTTLRWRSRLPTDPPFDGERITYRIGYRLTGVLLPQGDDVYLLDHDFAFADREGPIRRFQLNLTVEPPFEAADSEQVPANVELRNLRPGTSVPRTVRLRYLGEGAPAAAAPPPPSLALRGTALAVLLSALGLALALFVRGETAKGRFWGGLPAEPVDRAWLERELLSLPPEVVGAIWDRKVGSAEVSAVLARLVAEGKLATEVVETDAKGRAKEMRLTQLAHLSELDPRDRPLVRAILFQGRRTVTTTELREHYKTEGFRPVDLVKDRIEERVSAVLGDESAARMRFPGRSLGLILLALVPGLLVAGRVVVGDGLNVPLILSSVVVAFFLIIPAALAARKQVVHLGRATRNMLLPTAGLLLLVLWILFAPASWPGAQQTPGAVVLFVLLALILAAGLVPLWLARSRETPEAIRIRQRFVRAREHLKAQLARPEPDLDDAWFPYLLAFGLSKAMGRWSDEFGGEVSPDAGYVGSTAFTGSGSSGGGGFSSGGWTGGGSAFGGAGAASSWAAATSSMTSGVAPPSSSSGGGGGGGSSSGGGGGGGW
jgi:uncharacterized membrane protein YgcG